MEIANLRITDFKIKFRLRDLSEEKVIKIAESISRIGFLNPIALDTQHHLIAGFYRLLAYQP